MKISPQVTSRDLKQALRLKQQIEKLEANLSRLLGSTKRNGLSAAGARAARNMSEEGKARIAAAQKRRWAAWRKENA